MYFHLILIAIPSSLILFIKGMGFFYLMDEKKNVKKQCMAIIYFKQKLRVFDSDATKKKKRKKVFLWTMGNDNLFHFEGPKEESKF